MPADDPYCDFGGLPRSMCAHCRGRQAGGAAGLWPIVSSVRSLPGPAVLAPEQFTAGWFAGLWERHEAALESGSLRTVIQSRWHGRCRGCGDEWDEGDEIAWAESESAWVCLNCASQG